MTDLNAQVTAAVLNAEYLAEDPEASDQAKDAAYWELAKIEEALAATLSPGSLEGEIARKGAIRAALLGHKFAMASRLLSEYSHESGVTAEMTSWLTSVRDSDESAVPEY